MVTSQWSIYHRFLYVGGLLHDTGSQLMGEMFILFNLSMFVIMDSCGLCHHVNHCQYNP